jgi:D-sedoheptulose 7-phosphate isomerase
MSTTENNQNNIDKFYTDDPAEFAAEYFNYLKSVIDAIDHQEVAEFIRALLSARDMGANIYFIGNGGSAATASHFANDIAIGINDYKKPFKALSLTDNVPIITAIGNDFGYEEIFTRQLKVLAKAGDVLVAISASGNSPNLISAIKYANENDIKTVAITAFDGGKMKKLAKTGIHVPTALKEYGPAEDAHMILDHLVGSYLMRFVIHA